tara:strand:+ start:7098 stop:7415 length:318 start_codon:yes stop_codon:yes gene_type:complete
MSSVTETTPLHEIFDNVDVQKALFKEAFEFVRKKQNKTEDDIISISNILHYFIKEDTSKKDKIALSWTAICMIKHSQHEMEFTDEETNGLISNIIKKLKSYLEKN